MPENGLMRYITIAAIVIALYILLKHGKSGTVAQVSPNAIPAPPPGVNACCNSPLVSVNDPIPIATDYLPNVPAAGGRSLIRFPVYAPVTSPIVARAVKPLPIMNQPVATMQNVAHPYGVSQSNCVKGISAAQAQKIFPPITKITVQSGTRCCAWFTSTIGGCGSNVRCLRQSGACCLSLSELGSNCIVP